MESNPTLRLDIKKRYTDEQMIGFLGEAEAALPIENTLLSAWPLGGQLLPLAQQVRSEPRHQCVFAQMLENSGRKIADLSLLAGKKTVDRFALDGHHRQTVNP